MQHSSGRSNRLWSGLVGIGIAAVISLSAGAATGLAQYGETPPPTGTSGTGVSGVSGTGSEQLTLLKKCIAKAQTKYGDNRPKRKKAIRRCRQKYG